MSSSTVTPITFLPRRPATTPAFVPRIVAHSTKPTLPVETVSAPMQPVSEYDVLLARFVQQLQNEQQQGVQIRQETNVANVTVKTLTGRKFDRIVVCINYKNVQTEPWEDVYYFVNRFTGEIFGAKSRLAPNLNHFFGLISNVAKWDWSGRSGINKSDGTVREVGRYGQFRHYAPVSKF